MKRNYYISLLKILFIIAIIGNLIIIFIYQGLLPKNLLNIFTAERSQTVSRTCPTCNILLIDIDVLRADALPCYGYIRNTAPHICNLAKKSQVFKNNFSNAPWTLPSAFSTITSLLPSFHNIRTEHVDVLSPDIPTLADTLRQNRYSTYLFSDNNSAFLTLQNGGARGYDKTTSVANLNEAIDAVSNAEKPWFIHYYVGSDLHMPYTFLSEVPLIDTTLKRPPNLPILENEYSILLNKRLKRDYKKIFLQKTIDTYYSILVSPEKPNDTSVTELFYQLAFRSGSPEKYLRDRFNPEYSTYMDSFDQKSASDVAFVRMMYDTNIREVDAQIQRLLALVAQRPDDDTIIVIMSDHGELFGEHGKFSHIPGYSSQLYHTPLIIYVPHEKGKIINEITSNIDIFPTLLTIIGVKAPERLQGLNLMSRIPDRKGATRTFASSYDGGGGIVLQNSEWIYFLPVRADSINQSILFNKISDPMEENNVATKYPELTLTLYNQAKITQSYENISKLNPDSPASTSGARIDPEKIKRMKLEGYF